jgi:hypothetical protein
MVFAMDDPGITGHSHAKEKEEKGGEKGEWGRIEKRRRKKRRRRQNLELSQKLSQNVAYT